MEISADKYKKLKTMMFHHLELDPETSIESLVQDNTENWTSVRHLSLIMEIEVIFEVKFKIEEVIEMTSFEDIIHFLQKKLPEDSNRL